MRRIIAKFSKNQSIWFSQGMIQIRPVLQGNQPSIGLIKMKRFKSYIFFSANRFYKHYLSSRNDGKRLAIETLQESNFQL